MNETTATPERLRQHLDGRHRPDENGCWVWQGPIRDTGYGYFELHAGGGRRTVQAHRASYVVAHGPIPEGLVIDHLCRVRHCINPEHLEPVTQRENLVRGESPMARAIRTGRCYRGHARDESVKADGRCRQCFNDNARSNRLEREAADPSLREARLARHREYLRSRRPAG